jgi:hypothetical protein
MILLSAALSCGSEKPTPADPYAPEIRSMHLLGSAKAYSEVLLFEVNFADADADLGEGTLEIFIDGKPVPGDELFHLFLVNEVDPNAKEGTFVFHLEIFYKQGSKQSMEIAARLIDKAGRASATYPVPITLLVKE